MEFNFPEEFLCFIWQFKLYGLRKLYTLTGEEIEVLALGMRNADAGPDFTNAKIKIGETVWVGNIEIHIQSADWVLHQHHLDPAYNNVILHVVYENNLPIYRIDQSLIPVLVLKDLFPSTLLRNYEQLVNTTQSFPCQNQLHLVDDVVIASFLSRMLLERLVNSAKEIEQQLMALKGNWDEVFYRFLARSFGFKVNAIPMQILAQSLPQSILAKHKDQPLQVAALIFGQAGFLNQRFEAEYPRQLKREFTFLKKKYLLKSMDVSLWKFLRMRPQNFPTLRLAQFAALMVYANHLFAKLLLEDDVEKLIHLFEELPVHPFWKTHYHFNKSAKNVQLQLGKQSKQHLLINTLSVFLFVYGKATDQYHFIDRAIALLESLKPEQNVIVKQYAAAGVKVSNAFDTQALLQLKKNYCNEKKCLNCAIGIKILKR